MYTFVFFSVRQVSPAIDVALMKVNARNAGDKQWAKTGFSVAVSYADSMCDSAESLNHAIEFYMTKQVPSAC